MTTVTPTILGPGIQEEYDDALSAITDLRQALGSRPLTNTTPDGRVLLEVAWLEQEIRRQRLPIPLNQSYAGTIYYLSGSNELLHVPGIIDKEEAASALHRLYVVLKGYGLYKPRHLPVLIEMINELYDDAQKVWDRLSPEERATMDDIKIQGGILQSGRWPVARPPQDQFPIARTPALDRLVDNFSNRSSRISAVIWEGRRPYPARKASMAAPVPGLPDQAPPLPAALEGRLP